MYSDLKALLFDLDGTLYVSTPLGNEIWLAACRYMADLKGVELEAAGLLIGEAKRRLSSMSGTDTPLSEACIELGGDLRELHRRFAKEIDPAPFLTKDDRVVELLKLLGTKFELYIYTNNNPVLTAAIAGFLGIERLFRQVFTINDFWQPKPNRQVLAEIIRRIGRKPEECLFVGDRYDVDLRLPAEIGCGVFLVKNTRDLLPLCKLMSEEDT